MKTVIYNFKKITLLFFALLGIQYGFSQAGDADIALLSVTPASGPYHFGQTVTYNFRITNNSTYPYNIDKLKVRSYIPDGFSLDQSNNTDIWASITGSGSTFEMTDNNVLAQGASKDYSLVLTLKGCSGGVNAWNTKIEIFEYFSGPTRLSDLDNDGENTIEESIDVFDLALEHKTGTVYPDYNGNVSFDIFVYNQGNQDAYNIEVANYKLEGFDFVGGTGWAYDATTGNWKYTFAGPIAPGDFERATITLKLLSVTDQREWANYAEIVSAKDATGAFMTDIDGTFDEDPNNDAGGKPNSSSDNVIDGNGTGAIGSEDAATDEDNHDPGFLKILDLALENKSDIPATAHFGDVITFNLTVHNQGSVAVKDIKIKDYIPDGYDYNAADNVGAGWSLVGGILENNISLTLEPGNSVSLTLKLRLIDIPSDHTGYVNYAEIAGASDIDGNVFTDTADSDSEMNSNTIQEREVLPGTMYDNDIWRTGLYGYQDDFDAGIANFFDLALKNVVKPKTPISPYRAGDIIEFLVTVYNQGGIVAKNVKVIDYIPDGYEFYSTSAPTWTNDDINNSAYTTILQPLATGDSVELSLFLRVLPVDDKIRSYLNAAEIESVTDEAGNPLTNDMDSQMDNDRTNDAGGAFRTDSDDSLIGDGTGGVESTNAESDEDDHDVELPVIYDIALKNTLLTPPPYRYDQDHIFVVTVYNQGNMPMQDIDIRYNIAPGYDFVASAGWTQSGNVATYNYPGPLSPGQSHEISLKLRTKMTTGGRKNWVNYATVIGMRDTNGDDRAGWDIDSNTGSDTPEELSVELNDSNDDNVLTKGAYVGEDQDDHDPAGIHLFDLALTNIVDVSSYYPFNYDEIIHFKITVHNQGSIEARNVKITDYIPEGLKFVLANNPGWIQDALNENVEYTITNPIAPGSSTDIILNLTVIPNTDPGDSWINIAEISYAEDNEGNDMTNSDFDSYYDKIKDNDSGGMPDVANQDDFIEGDARHGATNIYNNEEDDHDPARIHVFDLALKKEMTNTAPKYGDIIDFEITIYNQGNDDAENVEIRDYTPKGFELPPTGNLGWTGDIFSGLTYTHTGVIPAKSEVTIPLKLKLVGTQGGENHWLNYAEIRKADNASNSTYIYSDPDSNPGSNSTAEKDVKPGDANDNNILSNDKGGDEDDHDPAGIWINDLALRKEVVGSGPYKYGDTVQFKVTVFNQGNTKVRNIHIVDYNPEGFEFCSLSFPSWHNDATTGNAHANIQSVINPGDNFELDLFYTLKDVSSMCKEDAYVNNAEIFGFADADFNILTEDFDSQMDYNPNNDIGGTPGSSEDNHIDDDRYDYNGDGITDEDDSDPARLEIVDVALKAQFISGNFNFQENHTFRMRVYNQGNVPVKNPKIKAYLAAGYEIDFTHPANANWSNVDTTAIINGVIPPCDSADLNLVLKMVEGDGGSKNWVNYFELTEITDQADQDISDRDIDSDLDSNTPEERAVELGSDDDDNIFARGPAYDEDQDDHDPAGIEFFDLALRNTVDGDYSSFNYNDIISFKIKVYNQGTMEAKNIKITDYVPNGFDFVAANNTGWTEDALGNVEYTITNPIAPGDSAEVSLKLNVIASTDPGDPWVNVAEISYAENRDGDDMSNADFDSWFDKNKDNDLGGTPNVADEDDYIDGDAKHTIGSANEEDEDDSDPARLSVFDLALKGEVTTTNPSYGDVVDFEITIYNQGNEDATSIEIADYIPEGFEFSTAINNGWSGDMTTGLNYTYSSVIIAGGQATIPLKLKLVGTQGGENNWINYTEIVNAKNPSDLTQAYNDPDSNPASDSANERNVKPGDPNDNNILSNDKGGDEDDHDPAGIWINDLALTKEVVGNSSYQQGSSIQFKIKVFNQGNTTVKNVNVVDYKSAGLDFSSINSPWYVNTSTGNAHINVNQEINPGESVELTLSCTVKNDVSGCSGSSLLNKAEIFKFEDVNSNILTDFDSQPDDNPNNDVGGTPGTLEDNHIDDDGNDYNEDGITDEDDSDPATIEIIDVAMKADFVSGDIEYLKNHKFRIRVYNQGNLPIKDTKVKAYLPDGYEIDFAANSGWSNVDTSTVISDVINPCDSFDVFVDLRMVKTDGGSKDWVNYFEVTEIFNQAGVNISDKDIDSQLGSNTPEERSVELGDANDNNIFTRGVAFNEDQDDHDPAGIKVFDLALRKTVVTSQPFTLGQEVEFKVTLYNQGSIDAQNIKIEEEAIPCNLEFSTSNTDWTLSGNNATYTHNTILMPGDSVAVPIKFKVVDCDDPNQQNNWESNTEIVSAEDALGNDKSQDDIDSDYDNNPDNDLVVDNAIHLPKDQDDDDHDVETLGILDLALNMVCDNTSPVAPGDVATFTISVYNQGNQSLKDIVVYDYISSGYSFLSGADNPGWSLNGTTAEYSYAGPLAPGNVATLKIKLTVQNTSQIQNWTHYAEIASAKTMEDLVIAYDFDGEFASNSSYERDVHVGDAWDNEILGKGLKVKPNEDMDDHDPASITATGKVGDFVWNDLNGNGLQDPGEPGIPNVVVELHNTDYTSGVATQFATTDANGKYLFDMVIPGTYYLKFKLYGEYEFTIANQGSSSQQNLNSDVDGTNGFGTTAGFEVKANDNLLDKDAGVYTCVELGDLVWLDYVRNNVYDKGVETGVNGLKVELYKLVEGSWKLWDIEFTGVDPNSDCGDGYYHFCTMPGEYFLRFVQPPTGIVPVVPNVGSDDNIDSDITRAHGKGTTNSFILTSGTGGNLTIDAGFSPMATIKNSMVWIDNNSDGIKDVNEPGVPNMRVELYDAAGIIYSSTTTKSDGSYELDYLQAEDYYLKFRIPSAQYSSYGFTESNKGNDDEDSDVTGENGAGTTALFKLAPQQNAEHKDAGLAFGTLPQNYLSVGAELKNKFVRVDWATANQYNVDKYIVQRSFSNLVDFVDVGEVKAKEETSNSYTFDDHSKFKNGVYYYRIISVDLDGFTSKSDVVAIFVSNGKEDIIDVYPNPIIDQATARFSLRNSSNVVIDILSIDGKVVRANLVNEEFGMGIYHANLDLNNLEPATYQLRLKTDNDVTFKKIIVVRK